MIYFIQQGQDGPVKIGTISGNNAASVSHRLMALQGGNPTKLRIIGFCHGGEKEEIMLHKEMRRYRISGEWFALRGELIELIKRLSILSEEDRSKHEETISVDELANRLQDEFDIDIHYKKIIRVISTDKKMPSYRVFGKKRYKYDECRDHVLSNKSWVNAINGIKLKEV